MIRGWTGPAILLDFEFRSESGGNPAIHCLSWKFLGEPGVHEVWLSGERPPIPEPFSDPNALFVAYYASAEMNCFLELGWPLPRHVLDLYPEFRVATNGKRLTIGSERGSSGLLGALAYYDLDPMDAAEKEEMRALARRGAPFSDQERPDLQAYCNEDVFALERLLPQMAPGIDLRHALLRGRFMKAAALMERRGVPIDTALLKSLTTHWETIKLQLIRQVDAQYGIYDGTRFDSARWLEWARGHHIDWPHLPSGHPMLDDKTFELAALLHPEVAPMHELRQVQSKLKTLDLPVASDGRHRTLLSAFGTVTGRNAARKSIFGLPSWLRSLISPTPGRALACIDWSQQELGIAAALSGDAAMSHAYMSGDPYLSFAQQAGAVPPGATKETHPVERERFKACSLGVLFGLGAKGLAERIRAPRASGQELLDAHHATYRDFWTWRQAAVDTVFLHGSMRTTLGWPIHLGTETRPLTLANFPMQAHGAEMMRLAACLAVESGIEVCAPIHDAFLIEAADDEIDDAVAEMQRVMADASRTVLGGFELRSDVRIIRHPDRLLDEKGRGMWNRVAGILGELEGCPPLLERAAHA